MTNKRAGKGPAPSRHPAQQAGLHFRAVSLPVAPIIGLPASCADTCLTGLTYLGLGAVVRTALVVDLGDYFGFLDLEN